MQINIAFIPLLLLAGAHASTHHNPNMEECDIQTGLYPPAANYTMPRVVVNLDLPPQQRWVKVMTPLAPALKQLLAKIQGNMKPWMQDLIKALTNKTVESTLNAWGEYGDEIRGIAAATDIGIIEMIIYNVAYELMGGCTSIVGRSTVDGTIFHGRNLDFGLLPFWDPGNNTWAVAEALRPLLMQVAFTRGGEIMYNSTTFGGYVGMSTAAKGGAFSITVDTRFDKSFDSGLLHWFEGNHNATFLTMATRDALENNKTYAEALDFLTNVELVGPAYMIIGGPDPENGAVVTRDGKETLDVWTLEQAAGNNSNFVIQTNYDHWKPQPFFDDRVTAVTKCLDKVSAKGAMGLGFPSLFDMLSAEPNMNLLTVHTTLIQPASGEFQSFLQKCTDPKCPMF